ncbi:energy-coupling factor transport system permease protein [Desulfocicer vacuolatum DSM 3385]|uniref:Energy-coupling factor transport system permease protein n=1 Tax=Desulfocicer vacuolatum DSM 3385 TaxID=1121400 RepID=A0A1W1YSG5_9BACT|nr:energy-coupling factor transporter transmembrane component T [Desulfocicer vacuolatum]SMC39137.1 energy-coupling factor transport system permease protein [Desulfocicer vacuolatum DSM 3385]
MHVLSAAEPPTGGHGFVSGLDVRTKILLCLSMSVAVVFLKSFEPLAFLTLASLVYVLDIGRYKMVGMCYLAICFMWLLSMAFMRLIHSMSPMIPVTEPVKMLVPFLRTMVMFNTILALALSSRIQTLLTSLKSFRLPIWLYIPSAVMIRFIPSFIKDIRQIYETMRIRGYSFNLIFILRHPRLAVRLMAAPILFRALRSADDLGIAAELKGVGYGYSTENSRIESYTPLVFKFNDAVTLVAALLLLIAAGGIQAVWGTDTTGMLP